MLALVAGLLALGVVPAAAYWVVSADGTGRRTLTPAATGGGLVAVAAAPGEALVPGGSVPLEVTVTNRGAGPVGTVEVRARAVRVTPERGLTCPDPVFGVRIPDRPGVLPAGRPVVLEGELSLAADAPSGCQGAVVDLDLLASADGVSR